MPLTPATYDSWYQGPRGAWVGETEYRLLERLLAPRPGESLLDVGCGTGYFTRRFVADSKLRVTGVDPDASFLGYARAHAVAGEQYLPGDARALPFADGSFDLCLSVTALCFIREQHQALAEMLRVTRRRFAIGLLNRRSLLYRRKGRGGGQGAYHGAHWHTQREIRTLLGGLPAMDLVLRSAVFLPHGGTLAHIVETLLPAYLPWGAFLVVAGNKRAEHPAPPLGPGDEIFTQAPAT
ncbi:MAG: class I SAM-dependent methyltransferase [Pseudomonadota bacterium]